MRTQNIPSVSLDEVARKLTEKANVKAVVDKFRQGYGVRDLDLTKTPYDWICEARTEICLDEAKNLSADAGSKLMQATLLKNLFGRIEYGYQKRIQAFHNVDCEKVSRVAGFFREGIRMIDLPLTEYSFEEIATAKLWALPNNAGVTRIVANAIYFSGRETFDRWRYERVKRKQVQESQDDDKEDPSCFGGLFIFR